MSLAEAGTITFDPTYEPCPTLGEPIFADGECLEDEDDNDETEEQS